MLRQTSCNKIRAGIVREREKNDKFRNPSGFATLSQAFNGFGKPPYWERSVDNLDSDETNNGFVNEALIVWMRPAPFATFRKKYGIIRDGLAEGEKLMFYVFCYIECDTLKWVIQF